MPCYCYRVSALVTADGAVAPDVPDGIAWVGNTDGTQYLVKTNARLPDAPGRTLLVTPEEIATVAQAMGLSPDEVMSAWTVGGER